MAICSHGNKDMATDMDMDTDVDVDVDVDVDMDMARWPRKSLTTV